jgi:hypothetical protein
MTNAKNEEIYESLIDAFREIRIAEAVGCCGAGRHLVIRQNNGTYAYLHDSAVQRGGDPVATGEDRVFFARRCTTENAWDAATENMTESEIDDAYTPERDDDGDITPEAVKQVCWEWAKETLSSMDDDAILAWYNCNENGPIQDFLGF